MEKKDRHYGDILSMVDDGEHFVAQVHNDFDEVVEVRFSRTNREYWRAFLEGYTRKKDEPYRGDEYLKKVGVA